MKKLKFVPAIILACGLVLSPLAAVSAETAVLSYELEADKLKSLGLFKGTDIGYELERTAYRIEAGIMLVRLLGKESEALGGEFEHPFRDVPEWAEGYVGYLYENGLTKGISDDFFAPFMVIDAKSYLTFILRSLGYSEDENDFSWENSVEDAYGLGVISSTEKEVLESRGFNRGLMAAMSYNAVNSTIKGENFTLAVKLVEEGAVSGEKIKEAGFHSQASPEKLYLPYLEKDEYLPYIKGLDIETALIKLRKAGAVSVDMEYEFDEIVKEGIVLTHDYTPYLKSPVNFKSTVVVSLGPSPLNHEELMQICEEKGFDEESIPYVIAAAKYIINNTAISKYDVFNRLKSNISDIKIQDPETSAGMSYAAVYDAATGYLAINRYVLSERLVLHEIVHALSMTAFADKIGFHELSPNSRKVTEAYTAYMADSSVNDSVGMLSSFDTGVEEIIFGGGKYFSDGPDNFTLGVYEPLFLLAGETSIELMFFGDINKYSREVLAFNEKYGEQTWSELWGLAANFIPGEENKNLEERREMAHDYFSYLDSIIRCLWIDLDQAQGDVRLLSIFRDKLMNMKRVFPLGSNGYRGKIAELENALARDFSEFGVEMSVERTGYWRAPDFHGMYSLEAYNTLAIAAASTATGYTIVESALDQGFCEGVLFKDPDDPEAEPRLVKPGEEMKLGGEYIIMIPAISVTRGYALMRDLVKDFGKYLVDYDDMGNYVVGRVLEGEGLSYIYEYTYFDYVNPLMQGRIVGQFPYAGTAVIPGTTTVVIKMLREYP